MMRETLIASWEQRRDAYARVNAVVDGAKLIDELLSDVRSCEPMVAQRAVTLREAAGLTGYSVEHLARLIRQGRLPNAGRKYAPRILVGDLPPHREFAIKRTRSYDVNADARTLRNGRQ